ncbi:MAG: DNA primase, partial [Burkholderiaceae bacterium]|nr:DNA primase [Burkholderiaceae bacterium]
MSIPASFIQELLARADLVEIVGRYVPLKKTGANFSGLCPFHAEKSPSFTVSPSKQFYHCFGCGKNGDAINFLMEQTGAGFMDTVRDLAQEYGMTVPDDDRSPAEREDEQREKEQRATLTGVLERAAAAYKKQLRAAPRAIEYLKRRGVSGQIARDFGLGYAPEGWRFLTSVFPRYDDPLLADSGLVIAPETTENEEQARRYDRFRDRIMFPIRNVQGQVIGFGGRVLGDEKPKYLNSPETPVFHKGHELYGLYEARQAIREQGYALVVEGYMDVVALAQLGQGNAVATLGTACTFDHVQKLFRFTGNIVFSFDGDAAGRHAARKALDAALPLATDVRSVKFLFLPPEHDPDSFIRAEGDAAFAAAVRDAVPLSRFLSDAAAQECDLSTAEGRSHFAANARPLWQAMPQGLLKQQLLTDIATRAGVDAAALLTAWGGERAPERQFDSDRDHSRGHAPSVAPTAPRSASRITSRLPSRSPSQAQARNIASLILRDTSLWEWLNDNDKDLLSGQDGLYGELFRWLDTQYLEHGAQPLAALLVAAQNQAFGPLIAEIDRVNRMVPTVSSATAGASAALDAP